MGDVIWVSVREAAAVFGVCDRTARYRVASGEWPSYRIGRRVVVPFAFIREAEKQAMDRERP